MGNKLAKKMNNPKVSIITVNYNTPDITTNCILSVLKNTKKIDYEIILIDNGSTDNSYKTLSNNFSKEKRVSLIKSNKNLGFSRGNNLGISKAKGEYVLLLNSDTIVSGNTIGEMAMWLDKNSEVGIATCALKNEDGTIQGTGGYFPNLLRVAFWMTIEDIPFLGKIVKPFHPQRSKSVFKNNEFFTKKREIDWVTGAFLLTRRQVISDIGMIDEDYFMYTEDVDFCYRAKSAGWKVMFLPKWSITHLGGKSSTSEFPILSEYKSIKLFYNKHYPKWQIPVLRIFLKIGALWRIPVFGILYGADAAKTYEKAFKQA